jgi:hypothetical protein
MNKARSLLQSLKSVKISLEVGPFDLDSYGLNNEKIFHAARN